MSDNLKDIFKNIKDQEVPAGLEKKILRKISLEKSWQAKKRLIFADTLMLGSLGAFAFAIMTFWNGIAGSEVWRLLKLIFTDAGIVANHWMDFSFSLLETFPTAHVAIVLAPIFLLLISANLYFKSASNDHTKAWT